MNALTKRARFNHKRESIENVAIVIVAALTIAAMLALSI